MSRRFIKIMANGGRGFFWPSYERLKLTLVSEMTENRQIKKRIIHFFIEMVYFRSYLVNPHVQAVQNMSGKGG